MAMDLQSQQENKWKWDKQKMHRKKLERKISQNEKHKKSWMKWKREGITEGKKNAIRKSGKEYKSTEYERIIKMKILYIARDFIACYIQ